jgi:hypothetical protein
MRDDQKSGEQRQGRTSSNTAKTTWRASEPTSASTTRPEEPVSVRSERYLEGAKRYADANRSDPFALARCLTHIRTGIVGNFYSEETKEAVDALYDARSDGGGQVRP